MTTPGFLKRLDQSATCGQVVQWKHSVPHGSSLGPAKVLIEFTFFPKLPLDLRIYIWRMAIDFDRVVWICEDIKNPGSDSDSTSDDENLRSIALLDKELELSGRKYLNIQGQRQLENFGFTNSHPAPELQNFSHPQHLAEHFWGMTRAAALYNLGPLPVLLHVCRESRRLLQSYGYELAFSTRTAPAQTWFNFKSDILCLDEAYNEEDDEASPTISDGMYNLGQLCPDDRRRVRKLSLPMCFESYLDGVTVPAAVHRAVQFCGNLEELIIVEIDSYDVERKNVYWNHGNEGGDVAVVDLEVEELWGHYQTWWRSGLRFWADVNNVQLVEDKEVERVQIGFEDLAKDVEEQLRNHSSFFPDRKDWTTPKVRFVMFMARHELGQFFSSREAYGRDVDRSYEKYVQGKQQIFSSPSPPSLSELYFRSGIRDLQWAVQHDGFQADEWFTQAREAIYSVRGWPSPDPMQLTIEAEEARLDMDVD